MNKKNKIPNLNTALIIFLIIALVVIFVISFGQVGSEDIKTPKEFKEDKPRAQIRYRRLSILIEKKNELKSKLDKKFLWMFFMVRFGLVSLWGIMMYLFFVIGWITDLEDFLIYSEASLLVIFTFNFLTFGNLTNLNNYIDLIKTRTKNWAYGKYLGLKEDINQLEVEQDKIRLEITADDIIIEGNQSRQVNK